MAGETLIHDRTAHVPAAGARSHERLRLRIAGQVQGVGFRPFVARLARELDLDGWVNNEADGVTVDIQGPAHRLQAFQEALRTHAPPRARVVSLSAQRMAPRTVVRGFAIRPSVERRTGLPYIPADLALCEACRGELLTPGNRRYRHPFIACCDCGPRWSLLHRLPYDRAHTAMARFAPCPRCRAEHDDPHDRRFHAQNLACPDCGPQLALWAADARVLARREEALQGAVTALRRGDIVAVKGLGGFHLMVDAGNAEAVTRLRVRKHRAHKPLAVMLDGLDAVARHCEVDDLERQWLADATAPIVLLRSRGALPNVIAPGNPRLGVMLPYTPLHQLLLRDAARPLVATSGNRSGEPLCHDEREALQRLAGIADLWLMHDREIIHAVDDSVLQVASGQAMVLRAARGWAPRRIRLDAVHDDGLPPAVLGLGSHLKNAPALALGGSAVLAPHVGDLDGPEALAAHQHRLTALCKLAQTPPVQIACDLHPDYAAGRRTDAADVWPGLPRLAVQHHHAHIAAVMAEHGLEGEVLGVAWDGNGLGDDGSLWGGEFFLARRERCERIATLRDIPLPGAERAMREPRRVALGVAHELGWHGQVANELLHGAWQAHELGVLERLLEHQVRSPRTSSVGRLFDAVAALLGLCAVSTFEGQAAMALQFAAEAFEEEAAPLPFTLRRDARPWRIDWAPCVRELIARRRAGADVTELARAFHMMLADMVTAISDAHPTVPVVLSGGCFQNRLLLETTVKALRRRRRPVWWAQALPPNDGALALGQVAVARARWRAQAASCA